MTLSQVPIEQSAERIMSLVLPYMSSERIVSLVWQAIQERDAEDPAVWQIATLRGELAKPLIEARSGPSLSIKEVAALLSVSIARARDLVRRRRLIVYPALDGPRSCFPIWQFTAAIAPAKIHAWVAPLLAAYGPNGWGLVDFLTVPRVADSGRNYLHKVLWESRGVSEVISAARRCNPD